MGQPEQTGAVIDHAAISQRLEALDVKEDPVRIREIIAKALELQGLGSQDVEALISVSARHLIDELFHTARTVKEAIYGPRIFLFAPLYIRDPNALSTFLEYLIDYASPDTGLAGEKLMAAQLDHMDEQQRARASRMLDRVSAGGRDVYV